MLVFEENGKTWTLGTIYERNSSWIKFTGKPLQGASPLCWMHLQRTILFFFYTNEYATKGKLLYQ